LHYDLGFLYFKQGVGSLAKDELKKGLALNPGAPMAERARAVLQEIGRPAERQEPSPASTESPAAAADTNPEPTEPKP
jgi:hypothetical protein